MTTTRTITVYSLWRYLDEWELVKLSISKDAVRNEMWRDSKKWTVPVQYRIDMELVWDIPEDLHVVETNK